MFLKDETAFMFCPNAVLIGMMRILDFEVVALIMPIQSGVNLKFLVLKVKDWIRSIIL